MWFKKLAARGNATAQVSLANMYAKGEGVGQSDQEAFKWFQKGGVQGDPEAEYNLGVMFKDGKGVTQDNVKALMWFTLSADQNNEQAKGQEAQLAKTMSPTQINTANVLVQKFHTK